MIWLYILSILALLFAVVASTKYEIKKLRVRIQLLQDTLDHYGMRMSNKMPDKNKYYKRWYK